jgi:AraC-like DNA-binding protein
MKKFAISSLLLCTQLAFSQGFLKADGQKIVNEKLIEKAKELLSTSNLSVSEIAYRLGFEFPQSFNKLFKKKTDLTPLEFKQSFN